MKRSIYIGFDPREAAAFAVCYHSLERHMSEPIETHGLVMNRLRNRGLYTRKHEPRVVDGRSTMWDPISGAGVSTQHANARFLTPFLAREGWALFCDGDILYRDDIVPVFESLNPEMALYCVKHDYRPISERKMDGQVQTRYQRKNWTSFMFYNCDHPANKALTIEMINTLPGRDLHRLCWIEDENLIGELSNEWNWLVGHSDLTIEPKCVHFTEGVPDMPGYEHVPYAEEWRRELELWGAHTRSRHKSETSSKLSIVSGSSLR